MLKVQTIIDLLKKFYGSVIKITRSMGRDRRHRIYKITKLEKPKISVQTISFVVGPSLVS